MYAAAPPLSQEGITQMIRRDLARPACSLLIVGGRSTLQLQSLGWTVVSVNGDQNLNRSLNAFEATAHKRDLPTGTFILSDADRFSVPMRVIEERGEIYDGPRGKLVVIKKR